MQCDVTSVICVSNEVEYLDKKTMTKTLQKKLFCEFKLISRT